MYVLVKAVSIVFRSVVDLENLCQIVETVCGTKVHLECIHRLGALHYCSQLGIGK